MLGKFILGAAGRPLGMWGELVVSCPWLASLALGLAGPHTQSLVCMEALSWPQAMPFTALRPKAILFAASSENSGGSGGWCSLQGPPLYSHNGSGVPADTSGGWGWGRNKGPWRPGQMHWGGSGRASRRPWRRLLWLWPLCPETWSKHLQAWRQRTPGEQFQAESRPIWWADHGGNNPRTVGPS